MPSVHLLIKGKVQGVYFRACAKEIAQTLDLRGWVKNKADGSVEAVASGSEKSLQQFIEWCKRGPEKAVVSTLNATSIEQQHHPDFRIIR